MNFSFGLVVGLLLGGLASTLYWDKKGQEALAQFPDYCLESIPRSVWDDFPGRWQEELQEGDLE